jgi:flagellar hook-associated protein 1 FlgK
MAAFGGLGTALSGLEAQQRAMGVISQNITNVDTPGYTRRTVQLTSQGSPPGSSIFTKNNGTGEGVNVDSITRIRDQFLDDTARSALTNQGAADQTSTTLNQIEAIVPEPSDTGISSQIQKFWAAWSDAANAPGSMASRTALLSQANTVATSLNTASAQMTNLRNSQITGLQASVAKVNSQSQQVAKLNGEIRTAIAAGVDPSDLQDQRDNLIDSLATSVGATTHANDDGTVDVFLGGGTLVRSDTSTNINMVQAGTLDPPLDTMPLQNVRITWSNGGDDVQRLGGQIGAVLTGVDNTIPRYQSQLDGVASSLVSTVNALHETGQGLDAVNDLNLDFFDPTKTTAATISLSSDVVGQPSRVALAAAGGGQLDGSLGQSIAALASSATGPDATYQAMVGGLGIETQSATDHSTVQDQITATAQDARTSVTGVNLDEEMTNLIAAQRAYESSARLMTTIDSMLDTLINRTGLTT